MIFVYLTLMASFYSAKNLRIVLTISGKCLEGCVNMGLSLNRRSADSLSGSLIISDRLCQSGYRLNPSNVEAVRTLKDCKPSTVDEMRRLQGLLGYYRRYIQDFARIAHPLFQLLQAASEDMTKSAYKTK